MVPKDIGLGLIKDLIDFDGNEMEFEVEAERNSNPKLQKKLSKKKT